MRQFILASFMLCFSGLGFSGLVFAAGSSTMGAPMPQQAPKSPQELAVENYNRGIRHRDKALDAQMKAVEQTDERKRAKLVRKSEKQFTTAAKRFRTAIKHNDRLFQAHGSLGFALRQLGQYEEALVAYNQALALNPRYAHAIEYRGETYLALGRLEETREAYGQLMQLDPGQANLLLLAIQRWLASPPDEVAAGEVETMRNWATERMALSRFVKEPASGSWDSD